MTKSINLKPQAVRVLEALRKSGSISPNQAARRGIMNLSARICELRNYGYDIDTIPLVRGGGSKYVMSAA